MVVVDVKKDIETEQRFDELLDRLKNDWNEIIEKVLLLCNRNYIDKRVYDVILTYRSKCETFNELFINTRLARKFISNDVILWSESIKKNLQELRSLDEKKQNFKKTAWKSVEEFIYRYLPELKSLVDIKKFEQIDEIADTTDINNVHIEFYKIFCYKIEIIKILVGVLVDKSEGSLSERKAIEEQVNKKYLETINEKEKIIADLQKETEDKEKEIKQLKKEIEKLKKENEYQASVIEKNVAEIARLVELLEKQKNKT